MSFQEKFLWLAISSIILLFVFRFAKFKNFLFKSRPKYSNYEIVQTLLNIDEETYQKIFALYKNQFGKGAARYARKTFHKWKSGEVVPSNQTFERFFLKLPKVMDYDLKCRVLRHLMEEYGSKETYQATVYTDDWEQTLEPIVRKIIDKPYTAELPAPIQEKLLWLSGGEMQIAQDILRKSQIEEGKIAVSMLRGEFEIIELMLKNIRGSRKITHQLKFPYGKINLEIKKRN